MRVLRGRNVNGLFYEGMHLLDESGDREESRAGPVLVAPWPVMSVYEQPMERVLFDARRDANPFFHLMEGLWMLAGRNDAKFLNRYIQDFGSRFAESASGKPGAEASGVIHDAYGNRWRRAMGFDQLDKIVQRLRANSQDRQAVLQMWDSKVQIPGQADLTGDWKTRPCNTHAYFRVRDKVLEDSGDGPPGPGPASRKVLDMTICCRSNDAVWGAHGANAVHFSMLMEYVAGRVGVQVGTMYQLSNNYHGYIDTLVKIGDPVDLDDHDPYECGSVRPASMATDWSKWDSDLALFMRWHDSDGLAGLPPVYDNEWFRLVPERVAVARHEWTRGRREEARATVGRIGAPDWRLACTEWMDRRIK